MEKVYRVHAYMVCPCYLDVKATSPEEANRIAAETDGGDFISDDNPYHGDFVIETEKTDVISEVIPDNS